MSLKTSAAATVSMVIVNHNVGHILADCVALGLDQVAEIIIVDNASSDDSVDRLETTFANEPRLRLIRNSKNLGFAAACNIGADMASGSELLFLNPDCLLQPDAVRKLTRTMDADSQAGMAGALLLNPDGTEQGGGRRAIPTPWRSFVRSFGLSRFAKRWPRLFFDFHLHTQPLPDKPIEVEAISGACMLVKREVMVDVGPWDEGYFLHCEDLDLCMRFRQKAWKIFFVPDATVIHYLGRCSRQRPYFVEWHKHKGMMRFYRKFFRHQYPGLLMWLVTLGVWLRFGGSALYQTARRVERWVSF